MSQKFDMNNPNHQLIIAGCTRLVDNEGWTAREVMELLDETQGQLWSALRELEMEKE